MNKQQLAAKIWESANQMRSKIEANEYKDYILGFIFYKFLSDQLVQFADKQGMSDAEIRALSEEDSDAVDYIKGELGYFIAYDNLFSTWLDAGSDFDVSNVRDALSAFSRLIHPNHKKLFDGIFDTLQIGLSKLGENAAKQTKATRNLLQLIRDIPMDGKQDYDVLGYIYEYLIEKFAANAGKKAGEFYTPHEVSLLMSEIIADHVKDKEKIEIYDPTSGSGSLLINIGRSVAKHIDGEDNIKYYAQELKANTYNLTRMNLVMRGILPDNIMTRNGDTLEDDWPYFDESSPIDTYQALYVDAVVSNPPYSQKWDPEHKDNDPRYSRFGMAPKSKADYAFLLHDLYHLKPDGIMTIVLPHGVLFRGGEEGKIREQLIEQNHIDAIIGLPADIFFGTAIPTVVLVLRKKRVRSDVLVVDASKYSKKVGKNHKLQASDIKRIVDAVIYRETRQTFSEVVSKDTIRKNGYNLNIPRYVNSFEDAEKWDLQATMLGGIPEREINELDAYWEAFPALRGALFKGVSEGYAELAYATDDLKKTIINHPQVQAFMDGYRSAFDGFDAYLQTELIAQMLTVKLGRQEEVLSAALFARLKDIALVDKYQAYQILNDNWRVIAADLEMFQTEGFQAGTQVNPQLITKKIKGKDTEVQDGWVGHILPFELVQSLHLTDELMVLETKQNRLLEITAELGSLVQSITEDDRNPESFKDTGDAFHNAGVVKEAKALRAEARNNGAFDAESYQAKIMEADRLIGEQKALNKSVKADAEALHMQTKAVIEELDTAQVHEMLKHKWIVPLLEALDSMPDLLISEMTRKVQALADKYTQTFADVAYGIAETEATLAGLIDQLRGNDPDIAGLAAFRAFLSDE